MRHQVISLILTILLAILTIVLAPLSLGLAYGLWPVDWGWWAFFIVAGFLIGMAQEYLKRVSW